MQREGNPYCFCCSSYQRLVCLSRRENTCISAIVNASSIDWTSDHGRPWLRFWRRSQLTINRRGWEEVFFFSPVLFVFGFDKQITKRKANHLKTSHDDNYTDEVDEKPGKSNDAQSIVGEADSHQIRFISRWDRFILQQNLLLRTLFHRNFRFLKKDLEIIQSKFQRFFLKKNLVGIALSDDQSPCFEIQLEIGLPR